MRGIKTCMIVPILCLAALAIMACNEPLEIDPKPEVAPQRSDLGEWFVHSLVARPDTSCPCCPIGFPFAMGMNATAFLSPKSKGMPCCPCVVWLVSEDGRGWRRYSERKDADSYEKSDFLFYSAARPDTTCPCCPIGHSGIIRDSSPCCICAFHAVGGTQDVREHSPIPIPEDPQRLISTDVLCPAPGILFVIATCDVTADPRSDEALNVALELVAGESAKDNPRKSWTIPADSGETGHATTITVRGQFEVEAGETTVSLLGNTDAKGSSAHVSKRNLSVRFVPGPDAGPIESR